MVSWLAKKRSAREKAAALRKGLLAGDAMTLIGVHDGMGAHLAERSGFDGIWVSGFGVSAMAHCIPDVNLTTMSEVLEAARRINQATDLPVIADCDNGFGSALNVRRTVAEFEAAGISGICIEDNTFPKRNSLIQDDVDRALIPIEEQARRIAIGKDAQTTPEFVMIARVESLIAGLGVEDALNRAQAYSEAGADALLIHSRDKTLAEIEAFLAKWEGGPPLVAVPTLFPDFSVADLYSRGFQAVIFANQLMRASVLAMQSCLSTLSDTQKAEAVEDAIAPVDAVFDIVDTRDTLGFVTTSPRANQQAD